MPIEGNGPSEAGRNISLAAQIIDDAFRQIAALLARLDKLMSHRSLYPTRSSRVGLDVNMNLEQVDRWLQRAFYRAYMTVPMEGPPQDRVLAFEIELLPQDVEEPGVFGVALQLKRKIQPKDVWDAWVEAFFGRVPANPANTRPTELTEATLAGVFPLAARGSAFCVPLATLTDSNLDEKLVRPCCEMFRALGTPPTPSDARRPTNRSRR